MRQRNIGQECGNGVIMASVDKSFDPSTTIEETTDRREATERHVPPSDRQKNDLQEPSEQQPQRKLEALPLRTPVSDGQRHVLLVEDNTINQHIIQRKLSSKSFCVSTTNNGCEAVEFIAAALRKKASGRTRLLMWCLWTRRCRSWTAMRLRPKFERSSRR
jgi:hypothetical protein